MWCDLERPSGKPQLKLNYLFKREYLWDLAATPRGWYAQLRGGDTRSHLTESHWPPSSPSCAHWQTNTWLTLYPWVQFLGPAAPAVFPLLYQDGERTQTAVWAFKTTCHCASARLVLCTTNKASCFWTWRVLKKMKSLKVSLLLLLMGKHLTKKRKWVVGNDQCLVSQVAIAIVQSLATHRNWCCLFSLKPSLLSPCPNVDSPALVLAGRWSNDFHVWLKQKTKYAAPTTSIGFSLWLCPIAIWDNIKIQIWPKYERSHLNPYFPPFISTFMSLNLLTSSSSRRQQSQVIISSQLETNRIRRFGTDPVRSNRRRGRREAKYPVLAEPRRAIGTLIISLHHRLVSRAAA